MRQAVVLAMMSALWVPCPTVVAGGAAEEPAGPVPAVAGTADRALAPSQGGPDTVRADATTAARTLIDQKMAMVQKAVSESRLASRVTGGGADEARHAFADATRLLQTARALLAGGSLTEAERTLDQAIWALVRALQLSPGSDSEPARRARYEEMDRTLISLYAAYLETSERLPERAAEDPMAVIASSRTLGARARDLAASGRYEEAVAVLEQAQRDMLEHHQRLLGRDTIDYTPVFSSVEDEYRYELARSRDYQRLIPLAVREYDPPPAGREQIESLTTQGGAALSEAVLAAASGRHADALERLSSATEVFRRALDVAGLVLPGEVPVPASSATGDVAAPGGSR